MTRLALNPTLPFAVPRPAGPPCIGGAVERRAWRVSRLLMLTVLLSVIDLVLTLGHMSTTGMFENNPIVLMLMSRTDSVAALGVFKGVTVAVFLAVLWPLRRRPQAELGAWLSAAVLAWVFIEWVRYTGATADLDLVLMSDLARLDPHWVALGR